MMNSLIEDWRATDAKIVDELQKPVEQRKDGYLAFLQKRREDLLAKIDQEGAERKRENERAEREKENERVEREKKRAEREEERAERKRLLELIDKHSGEPELIHIYKIELEKNGWVSQMGSTLGEASMLLPDNPPALLVPREKLREYLEKDHGRIPVSPAYWDIVQATASHLLFNLVPGNSLVASRMTSLLSADWGPLCSELETTCNMWLLLHFVFDSLQIIESPLRYRLLLNSSEDGSSRVLRGGCRPDTLILADDCTLLVGEDKKGGNLKGAYDDLRDKLCGLNRLHYGNVPYILAYAASGSRIQLFNLSTHGGKLIDEIADELDMVRLPDRIRAILLVSKLYHLLRIMARELPLVHRRHALGTVIERGDTTVLFFPDSARKRIINFPAFCGKYGGSLSVLQRAYAAAGRAARLSNPPFIVTAIQEPKVSRSDCYEVTVAPLGFHPPTILEKDLRALARACCLALQVLHKEKLVHRDVREPNVVCLDGGQHWMLIDLEHAGEAGGKVPEVDGLAGWVGGTLDEEGCFTPHSDMYMLGVMLSGLLPSVPTQGSLDFVDALKQKRLTAEEAIQQPWLADQAVDT
eukprot:TRINITY_DN1996_c0_g1_i5.p1 TRINITY_DN1996_c0_g1~~TRINITY_DN1996_c0_g1_i5.p1  ORF type:complete len:584 (-),score=89.29 TRINITY_DN1996_c0_g1_i5:252-2003(-)